MKRLVSLLCISLLILCAALFASHANARTDHIRSKYGMLNTPVLIVQTSSNGIEAGTVLLAPDSTQHTTLLMIYDGPGEAHAIKGDLATLSTKPATLVVGLQAGYSAVDTDLEVGDVITRWIQPNESGDLFVKTTKGKFVFVPAAQPQGPCRVSYKTGAASPLPGGDVIIWNKMCRSEGCYTGCVESGETWIGCQAYNCPGECRFPSCCSTIYNI